MDGACEINEVFLQEVKVPAENMIGEVNKGWTYAKFLLGHERLGAAHVGLMEARLQQIKEISNPNGSWQSTLGSPTFPR